MCIELGKAVELVLVELAKGMEPSEAERRGDVENRWAITLEKLALASDAELESESVAPG